MTISYEPLWATIKKKGLSKTDLAKGVGLSSATMAKMGRGEPVSIDVLSRLCSFLHASPNDVIRFRFEEKVSPLLRRLQDEMEGGISGGIYHEFQIQMTYNSNHIEGSRLSEEDTRYIFDTESLLGDGSRALPINDIAETTNHFDCIRYIIENANEPVSEKLIKHLHFLLKGRTSDSRKGYPVGEYKRLANVIGGKDTVAPEQVPEAMKSLVSSYLSLSQPTFEQLVGFHYRFESIHPFHDGNGRVGRLILAKECLRLGYLPVLIDEEIKAFYYRGLSEFERMPEYLLDTCRAGQDKIASLCDRFGVEYSAR